MNKYEYFKGSKITSPKVFTPHKRDSQYLFEGVYYLFDCFF